MALFNPDYNCLICDRHHALRVCTKFLVMSVTKKMRFVIDNALCSNCFAQSHLASDCTALHCKRCDLYHNTLLHPMAPNTIWHPMTARGLVSLVRPDGTNREWVRAQIMIDPNARCSWVDPTFLQELGVTDNCIDFAKIRFKKFRGESRVVETKCYLTHRFEGKRSPSCLIKPYFDVLKHQVDISTFADIWWNSKPYQFKLGSEIMHKLLLGAPVYYRPGCPFQQNTIFGLAFFGESQVLHVEEKDE